MSAKILGLVLEHFPGGDHVSLSIAIVLADAADPDGTNVRPSVARVAKLSRTSERTVQTHLRKFEESGFLEKVAEGGGRGRPTEFKINLGWILKHPSLIEELALEREKRKGAAVAPFPETVQIDDPKGEKTLQKGCRNPAAAAAPNPQPQTLDPEKQLQPVSDSEQSSSGGCLFWPENIHPKIQKAISDEIAFLDLETQQLALDEFAARLVKGDLGNPLKWFQGMVTKGVIPTPPGQAVAHLREKEKAARDKEACKAKAAEASAAKAAKKGEAQAYFESLESADQEGILALFGDHLSKTNQYLLGTFRKQKMDSELVRKELWKFILENCLEVEVV